mgnify:CR=1 FL=1
MMKCRHKLNKFFINTITKIIQNNSQWGLDYIKDELMKYSQQEFVDLVEKRVGDGPSNDTYKRFCSWCYCWYGIICNILCCGKDVRIMDRFNRADKTLCVLFV